MTEQQIAQLIQQSGGTPVDAPVAPPVGCLSVAEHEQLATAVAGKLEAKLDLLLAEESPMMASRAKEMALAIARFRKMAADLASERERFERLERLRRHEAEMRRVH